MITEGQNIYDFCLQTYGTLEQIFDLIIENNLNLNSDLNSGQELNINTLNRGNATVKKLYKDKGIVPVNGIDQTPDALLSVFIQNNTTTEDDNVMEYQNIFDICLQHFGTLEQIFEVVNNNNLTLNSFINGGQFLNINAFGKGDETIKDYYKRLKLSPNNNTEYPEGSALDVLLQWPEFLDKDIIIQKQLIIL